MPSPWVRSLFPARKTLKSLRACCIRILYGFLNWLHFYSAVEAPQHPNYRKSSIKPPPPPPGGGAFLFLSPFERRGGLFILEKTMVSVSGGSRPGDNGGPGHPDPEIKWGGGGGAVSKNFFRLFGPQFGLKIRAPPPAPSPGSDTVSSP